MKDILTIDKWIKSDDALPKKVTWQCLRTTDDDARGYTLEGVEGTWLTIVSTFNGDAGQNILSINPQTNPNLASYTEVTEAEAAEEIANYNSAQKILQEANQKKERIEELEDRIDYATKTIARQEKILAAVKANIVYEGSLELMTAVHNFDEASLEELKTSNENNKILLTTLKGD